MMLPLLILICCFASQTLAELRLLQIVYRHGDRTPSHTFPTDPYPWKWKEGREQLTHLGVLQQRRLGEYLRQRYNSFLPADYHVNHTWVRSTDSDRAIQSAAAQLQGLFPNQLVPIHTVPIRNDQLLKMSSPCPAYKKLWRAEQHSERFLDLEAAHRPLFMELEAATQLKNIGLLDAFSIADPVRVWLSHNLTFPPWATPKLVNELLTLKDNKQGLRFATRAMQRLRGGPMVAQLLTNIRDKVSGKGLAGQRRLYAFSGHDSSVAAILANLGVYNNRNPPYASVLMVELHHKGPGTGREAFFVRLLFRNETQREPWLLKLPRCSSDCPLTEFENLASSNLPVDIQKECFPEHSSDIHMAFPAFPGVQWSWIVSSLITLIVLVTFAAIYKKYI